jgi:hypothetical protein
MENVPTMDPEAAWDLVTKADRARDLDDLREVWSIKPLPTHFVN